MENNQNNKTIILVEDDQIILRMYSKKFAKEGFKVIQAADGEAGWQAIQGTSPKPDVALLDIMLPKMNGFELLEKIKASDTLKEMPVILLTNLGSGPIDKEKGRKLGAALYLIKSELTPAQVVEQVKGVIK